MRKPLKILAAMLLAASAIAPAAAQDFAGTERVIVRAPGLEVSHYPDGTMQVSRTVAVDDRDLTTRDGVRAVRARIYDVARDVCEELRDRTFNPLQPTDDLRGCTRDAYRKAMIQLRDMREDVYYDR